MREEKKIRNIQSRIAKKLKKVNKYLTEGQNRARKDEFLEKFMMCEVGCKSIMEGYYDLYPKKDPRKESKDIKLEINRIRPALKAMGYPYDEHLIAAVFGSTRTRNSKSCKRLRDGIVHSFSLEDMDEVVSRNDDLHKAMDAFIAMVDSYPKIIEKTKKAIAKKTKKRVA